eukprot:TRINITY_DN27771_c0_g1_i1.p1 TRINITY_DN27771_c0_g1~~TRINITY_DN27771_c0_g1_i1.p1  ORF type:complete len:596 (+),score=268.89 TRINITY_DN27771_c0_g1_i1:60-1847(+)
MWDYVPGMARHLMGTVIDAGEDSRPLVSGNQVQVTHLGRDTHIDDVRLFFHGIGDIVGMLEQSSGGNRSVMITFSDHDSALAALKKDGSDLGGQPVSVSPLSRKTTLLQGRTVAMLSSIFNLMNAIVGAGTLSLAYIMKGSGILLFIILLLVMVVIIDYSLQLLLAAALTTRVKGEILSYERLGALAWGEQGRILVSAMILIQNTGAMVTYFKVFKDVIPSIMELVVSDPGSNFRDGNFMTSLAALFVFVPACSSKIGFLSYVGLVAVFLTVFFVIFVTVKSQTLSEEDTCASNVTSLDSTFFDTDNQTTYDYSDCKTKYFAPSVDTFLALPTICFSFVCHTSVLPVFHELQEADEMGRSRRSQKRIMKVVHVALLGALSLYLLGATFGYLTFHEKTNQDLLSNYGDIESDKNSPVSVAVRMSFMAAVVSSIPLLIFPYRRSLDNLKEAYLRLKERDVPPELEGFSFWWRHILQTAIIVGAMLAGALFVPHITTVFNTVGATSSVSLVFLLPSAMYMKLCLGSENMSRIRKKGSALLRETGDLPNGAPGNTQDPEQQEYDLEPPYLAIHGPKAVFILGCTIFVVSWGGIIYQWST